MPLDVSLPDDLSACQRMIRELLQTLHERDRQLTGIQHRLDQLLRRLYGPRSERLHPDQPSLFGEEGSLESATTDEADASAANEGDEDTTAPAKKKKKYTPHGRQELPKHLPRQLREHDLPEAQKLCPCCQQQRVKIGVQTSEQLDYVPASYFVIEHQRPTYACLDCLEKAAAAEAKSTREEPVPTSPDLVSFLPPAASALPARLIETAPLPKQPIFKGLAGPGLLAHLIVSKYGDHLPLYRLEGIIARHGVELARSTMGDWLAACAQLLTPLHTLMCQRVLQSLVIHNDDTTLPVQEPGRGKTKTGRIWASLGDRTHRYLVFNYTPDRSRDGPEEFFRGYRGHLQVDAYSSYECLFVSGDILEAACWAHVRRKFFEARSSDAARSHAMLGMIRGLYDVEKQVKKLEADADKVRYRQEHARPLLTIIEKWLSDNKSQVLPKSPLAEAIGYASNNWIALNRYVDVGYLAIDNNPVEGALRPIALGRKNYMFAGSDGGGRTAAVLYSFVGTCKLLGIEPFAYLRDVLTRLPAHPPERLDELLPDTWAQAQRAAAATA